jgi:predicted acyl esterase
LTEYPDFSLSQPFLDEIITHPAPDAFSCAAQLSSYDRIPGFHVTSWFDIFQTSVIAAFQKIQARTGTQKLWAEPNEHYFVYSSNFWPRDPYFEWFGHWLKDKPSTLISDPPVDYSPRAWVDERVSYVPNDWVGAERWPPPGVLPCRLYLGGDGGLARCRRASRAAITMTPAGRSQASAGVTC